MPAPVAPPDPGARSGGKQPAAGGGLCTRPAAAPLNFADISGRGPQNSWGHGEPKASKRASGRPTASPRVAPSPRPAAGHASLSPAPSYIHRSPQRCDSTGGRRHRNALRVPGQWSHLVFSGDSVVVSQGAASGAAARAGAQCAQRPKQGNPPPTRRRRELGSGPGAERVTLGIRQQRASWMQGTSLLRRHPHTRHPHRVKDCYPQILPIPVSSATSRNSTHA